MINMNMLIISMPMISENQLFNMHLSIFFKTTNRFFFYFVSMYFFKSKPQVEEIFDNLYYLGFVALNCTYVLSTYEVKIIIFQSSNVKVFLNTIWLIYFKNTFHLLFIILKFFKLYIQQIINSLLSGQ
jgi:hypothetical protein